jgi:hypothetical protein
MDIDISRAPGFVLFPRLGRSVSRRTPELAVQFLADARAMRRMAARALRSTRQKLIELQNISIGIADEDERQTRVNGASGGEARS